MKLKKLLAAAIAPLIAATGLTACSGGESKIADIAPSEVLKAVLEEVTIDSCVEKGKDNIGDYYSSLDTAAVEDAAVASSGNAANPDEVAIIKCKSESDAAAAKEVLQSKLDNQKSLYETYSPGEMYKLEDAEIFTKGNYAVYIALSDNGKAKKIVEDKLSA